MHSTVPLRRGALLLAVVLAGIFVGLVAHGLSIKPASDDAYFSTVLRDHHNSVWEFVAFRYGRWSGRILPDALTALLVGHPLAWKLGIPLAWLASAWAASAIALTRNDVSRTAAFLLMAFLLASMQAEVMEYAAWWVTGFFNYLLPATAALLAVEVFIRSRPRDRTRRVLSYVALCAACYNEQVVLALAACIGLLYAFRLKRRETGWYEAAFMALLLINAAILFGAPGNRIRLAAEVRWMPEFADYGFIDKVRVGVELTSRHLLDPHNVLARIAAFLLSAQVLLASQVPARSRTARLTTLVMLGIYVASGLMAGRFWNAPPGDANSGGPAALGSITTHIQFVFAIVVIGAMMHAGTLLHARLRDAAMQGWLLLVGVATIMALGFSPSAYASGPRVFFVFDVLVVLHIGRQVALALQDGRWHRPPALRPADPARLPR